MLLLCHTSLVLPPSPTELQTSPSLSLFPDRFLFLLTIAFLFSFCCAVSFWDCRLLNSSEMPKAGITGTGRYKAMAHSCPRKSVAEFCESSAHFLMGFCSLGSPESTQTCADQRAADRKMYLFSRLCVQRYRNLAYHLSRDTSRQQIEEKALSDWCIVHWVIAAFSHGRASQRVQCSFEAATENKSGKLCCCSGSGVR